MLSHLRVMLRHKRLARELAAAEQAERAKIINEIAYERLIAIRDAYQAIVNMPTDTPEERLERMWCFNQLIARL